MSESRYLTHNLKNHFFCRTYWASAFLYTDLPMLYMHSAPSVSISRVVCNNIQVGTIDWPKQWTQTFCFVHNALLNKGTLRCTVIQSKSVLNFPELHCICVMENTQQMRYGLNLIRKLENMNVSAGGNNSSKWGKSNHQQINIFQTHNLNKIKFNLQNNNGLKLN